jgi:hypothetical protein
MRTNITTVPSTNFVPRSRLQISGVRFFDNVTKLHLSVGQIAPGPGFLVYFSVVCFIGSGAVRSDHVCGFSRFLSVRAKQAQLLKTLLSDGPKLLTRETPEEVELNGF